MMAINEVSIRNGHPFDHGRIVSVMPTWWDGRDLSAMMLKVFFIHFGDTVYVTRKGQRVL